ncbi:unnamed protein product [Arctogadus glacialis]
MLMLTTARDKLRQDTTLRRFCLPADTRDGQPSKVADIANRARGAPGPDSGPPMPVPGPAPLVHHAYDQRAVAVLYQRQPPVANSVGNSFGATLSLHSWCPIGA